MTKVDNDIMTKKYQSSNRIEITEGDRFGRLIVLNEEPTTGEGKSRRRWFKCLCDCGKVTVVRYDCLRRKVSPTESCGCIAKERTIRRSTKHGMCGTPEYQTWVNIKKRCYVPTHVNYQYYGARGVTVSDEWLDDFDAFLSHIGKRPSPNYSIDRIDPNKGYCPGNVKWSTGREQQQNRRDRRFITYGGEAKTIRQWAKQFNFDIAVFYDLTSQGITESEALMLAIESK